MLRCGPKAGIFYLSMGHFIADFYINFLPVLLPLIMTKLGLSLTMCGILVMVVSFAGNTVQPFFGYVVDRHDCARFLPWIAVFCGIFVCTVGYVPNQPILFLFCAMMGFLSAAIHPLGVSLLSRVGKNPANLGRYMSYYIVCGNIGFAIVPVVVTGFLEAFGLMKLPLLALPGVILGLIYYYTGIYKLPTASAKKTDGEADDVNIGEILKNISVVKINIAQALRCWTHVAVATFLPLVLLSKGYSSMMASTLLAVFLMGAATGGITGGELGTRFGHKRLVVSFLSFGVIPVFFFFNYPDAGIFSAIALFLAGACSHGTQPSSIVWVGKLMPKYLGVASGMMMGLCFGLGSMGAAVTAAVGDYIGLETAMFFCGLPMTAAALIMMTTPYPED